ncbi:MAG: DUF1565 domain-containing protein [bacterium]
MWSLIIISIIIKVILDQVMLKREKPGVGVYLHNSSTNTVSNNTISDNIGGKGGHYAAGWWYVAPGRGGIGCGIYLCNNSINNNIFGNTILNSQGGEGDPGGWLVPPAAPW